MKDKQINHYFVVDQNTQTMRYENPQMYLDHLHSLPVGKRMVMNIYPYEPLLSDRQRRYYFGVVVKYFMEAMGLEGFFLPFPHLEPREA